MSDDDLLTADRVQYVLYAVVFLDAVLYLFLFETVASVFSGSVSPSTVALMGFYVAINVLATYLVVTVE